MNCRYCGCEIDEMADCCPGCLKAASPVRVQQVVRRKLGIIDGAIEDELRAENARLRAALEGWVKYFQSDVPMTGEGLEAHGEDFTRCWFETEKLLSPNEKVSDAGD